MITKEFTKNLVEEFEQAFSHQLVSILLYGTSIYRSNPYEGSNVLLLFKKIEQQDLEKIKALINGLEHRISPLLLTESEIKESADIYPVKFTAIKLNHVVLYGIDPFSRLTIHHDHLRLRCEQELMNVHLRLRYAYITSGDFISPLEADVKQSLNTVLNNIMILLDLKNISFEHTLDHVIAKAENQLKVDMAPIRKILDWAENDMPEKEFTAAYFNYLSTVGSLVQISNHH